MGARQLVCRPHLQAGVGPRRVGGHQTPLLPTPALHHAQVRLLLHSGGGLQHANGAWEYQGGQTRLVAVPKVGSLAELLLGLAKGSSADAWDEVGGWTDGACGQELSASLPTRAAAAPRSERVPNAALHECMREAWARCIVRSSGVAAVGAVGPGLLVAAARTAVIRQARPAGASHSAGLAGSAPRNSAAA